MISLLLVAPLLFSVAPSSAPAGSPGVTVEIAGHGFTPACVGRWNGRDRATSFVSRSRLRVHLRPSDVIAADSGVLSVYDRAGDASSGAIRFEVVGTAPEGQARLFLLAPPMQGRPGAQPAAGGDPSALEPRRVPGKRRL